MGPTIRPLKIVGMAAAISGFSHRRRTATAASSVAMEPSTTSYHTPPPSRLPSRQPMNRPGTASAVSTGSSISASAMRNCTAPKLMAWNTKVNSRYRAAMMAARVRDRVESFMVDLPFGEAAAEKRRSMDLSMPSRA